MIRFFKIVEEICLSDKRYKPDSYEFVLQALHFTQKKLKRKGHIAGKELLGGMAQFALDQYGPMARAVLKHWGIAKTDDFGNIVFNMIQAKLLSKSESDSLNDFKDVYDFDAIFSNVLGKRRVNILKKPLQTKN